MDEERWRKKQDNFLDFLRNHNAENAPYRVDLDKRLIYWVDESQKSLVVADCKVLLSYALSNNSVMMAWVNRSLIEGSAIEPVPEMDDIYTDCQPEDVWELSVEAADAVDADAIYRTPSPQSWVMLALWNLRPGGDEQFTSGSPKSFVHQVVRSLIEHPERAERQVLLDNYAESLLQMASHPYKGTEFETPLKDTARAFRNLLIYSEPEKQNEGLIAAIQSWDELPE